MCCEDPQERSGTRRANLLLLLLAYEFQRRYLARKYASDPATAKQLWTRQQLRADTYETGTQITNHFEVVDKSDTEIAVRCGDSPLNRGPRDSDGLFVISATVDRDAGEVELGLKSCFFPSARRVEGICGPMPSWMAVSGRVALYLRIRVR